MALNVGGLTKFTDELQFELVSKIIAKGRTAEFVKVQPGIKNASKLNLLSNTVAIQAGACGFNTSGSVVLTQRTLTVTPLKVNDTICQATLEAYWVGQKMKPGHATDITPVTETVAQSYVDNISKTMDYNIWQGNLSASTYTAFDGFMHILTGETSRVSGATYTGTTTVAIVNAMVNAIPEAIADRSDLVLFISYGEFRNYVNALSSANNYHFSGLDSVNSTIIVPGTSVKVVATTGLQGKTNKVLTYGENLVIGTDLMNEEEKFDIFYSKDNDEVRVIANWKLGVQVAYPEFVVTDF